MEIVNSKSKLIEKIMMWTAIAMLVLVAGLSIFYYLNQSSRLFSDFAETLSYCISKNPYNGVDGIHSIYPPFAFLPFYLFALICKKPLSLYVNGEMNLEALVKSPTYIVSFILFYAICLALVLFLTAKISKFKGKKLAWLLIIVATFAPVLYIFFRGNNIIAALIFVMLFFWLYNSEKRWQREIANLCLACAIAIKIYPIVIVLFFIKDRRFLDMLKTILYSLVLLSIPFLLIEGGFGNIKHIWENFTKFNSGEGRNEAWSNISFDSLASKIAEFFGLFGIVTGGIYSILSKLFRFGMLITTIVVFILAKKSKKQMQSILLALLTYELFMGVSYAYTLSFLIVPLTMYLMDFENLSKLDKWFYGICFAVIAVPAQACFSFFFLSQIACASLLIKCYIDLINDFKENRKLKLASASESETSSSQIDEKKEEPVNVEVKEEKKPVKKVDSKSSAEKSSVTRKNQPKNL